MPLSLTALRGLKKADETLGERQGREKEMGL